MPIVPVSELPVEESERETPSSIRPGNYRYAADVQSLARADRYAPPEHVPPAQMSVHQINQTIHQFLVAHARRESLNNRAVSECTPGGREIAFMGNSFAQAAEQAARAMRNLAAVLRTGIITTDSGTIRETPHGPGPVGVNVGDEVSVEFALRPDNSVETTVNVNIHR